MATWPSTLPSPQLASYAIDPVDPTIRTDMEVGLARMRRRTAARQDKVQVAWLFDATQFSAFRTWFDDGAAGAAGGSAWFSVVIPLGNASSTSARFTEMWKAQKVSPAAWQITAKLEVR